MCMPLNYGQDWSSLYYGLVGKWIKPKKKKISLSEYLVICSTFELFGKIPPTALDYYVKIVIPILKFGKDIFICDLFIIREATEKWKNTQIN